MVRGGEEGGGLRTQDDPVGLEGGRFRKWLKRQKRLEDYIKYEKENGKEREASDLPSALPLSTKESEAQSVNDDDDMRDEPSTAPTIPLASRAGKNKDEEAKKRGKAKDGDTPDDASVDSFEPFSEEEAGTHVQFIKYLLHQGGHHDLTTLSTITRHSPV